MGKQQRIIEENRQQILKWHTEHRPTDWIARQLHISRELLKRTFPQYLGRSGGRVELIEAEILYNKSPKHCPVCQRYIPFKNRSQQCCSHKCSRQYNIPILAKQRKEIPCKGCKKLVTTYINVPEIYCDTCKVEIRKQQQKQYYATHPRLYLSSSPSKRVEDLDMTQFPRFIFTKCIICDANFITRKSTRIAKTCSPDCKSKLLSRNSLANPNCGGETNFKRYRYKDILMDSSWEVDIAKFLDEKNIEWRRSRKLMLWYIDGSGKRRRYYPDFFLPALNVYLDPKNPYKMKQDAEKLRLVREQNNIVLHAGKVDDIKQEILNHLVEA